MDQMWDSFNSYSVRAEFKETVPLFALFWENILSSFCSTYRLVEIGLERYFKSSSCPSYCLQADSHQVLSNSLIDLSISIIFPPLPHQKKKPKNNENNPPPLPPPTHKKKQPTHNCNRKQKVKIQASNISWQRLTQFYRHPLLLPAIGKTLALSAQSSGCIQEQAGRVTILDSADLPWL